MNIHGNKPPQMNDLYHLEQKQDKAVNDKAGETVSNKGGGSDKVSLSGRARDVERLIKAAGELPDVREAKVDDIKKSIEAGTYEVDPLKVAMKMLEEAL
jgi:negative regulator of flagellin synthesis FlgM